MLKIVPDSVDGHYDLAIALAMELKTDYPQTYANLAQAYADSSRVEQSRQAALKAIELARAQWQFNLARQIEQWLVANLPLPGSSAPGSSPTRPTNQLSP